MTILTMPLYVVLDIMSSPGVERIALGTVLKSHSWRCVGAKEVCNESDTFGNVAKD